MYNPSRPYPLPNLPGNTVYSHAEDRKPLAQTLGYTTGYAVVRDFENPTRPQTAAPQQARRDAPYAYDGALCETGINAGLAAGVPARGRPVSAARPPAWITFDRQVLRFNAYFKERVPESPVEKWRARKCYILHYLEDGTTQVEEPKEVNSGLNQGTLLRRHKLRVDDATTLTWSHLAVGGSLALYNRVYHLYACDDFTRHFMHVQGLPQEPNQPAVLDPFHHRQQEKENLTELAKSRILAQPREPDSKAYLANARKVLRFWACWDNTGKTFGEKLPFIVHYFLADNTMEVREVHLRNDGRDPFPLLVHRMKMPKKVYPVGMRPLSPKSRRELEDFYTWKDLAVGRTLNIYGRDLLLTSADEFTQRYYKTHLGCSDADFVPIEVSYTKEHAKVVYDAPPDVMGIGRDEDTIGNVRSLVPKQPKPDTEKMELYGSQAMRFVARFKQGPGYVSCGPADQERVFIFSYFLASDEIFIYEPPIKNAGILGGKFFERAKVHKPGTRVYYGPTDLFVGAEIPLVSRLFELLEADDWTLEFMEKHSERFPWASYDAVLWRMTRRLRKDGAAQRLREAMMSFDADGAGHLTARQFQALLAYVGLEFSLHEVVTLARNLSDGKSVPFEPLLQELGLLNSPPPPPAAGRQADLQDAYAGYPGAREYDDLQDAMGGMHMGAQPHAPYTASQHGRPLADRPATPPPAARQAWGASPQPLASADAAVHPTRSAQPAYVPPARPDAAPQSAYTAPQSAYARPSTPLQGMHPTAQRGLAPMPVTVRDAHTAQQVARSTAEAAYLHAANPNNPISGCRPATPPGAQYPRHPRGRTENAAIGSWARGDAAPQYGLHPEDCNLAADPGPAHLDERYRESESDVGQWPGGTAGQAHRFADRTGQSLVHDANAFAAQRLAAQPPRYTESPGGSRPHTAAPLQRPGLSGAYRAPLKTSFRLPGDP